MVKNLIISNSLMNVEQIRSQFSIFCWAKIRTNSVIKKEIVTKIVAGIPIKTTKRKKEIEVTEILQTDYNPIVSKKIAYFMGEVDTLMKKHKVIFKLTPNYGKEENFHLPISINYILEFFNSNKEIPQRFHPEKKDISKTGIMSDYKLRLKREIRKKIDAVNYYKPWTERKKLINIEIEQVLKLNQIKVYEYVFPYSVISLIEQKQLNPTLVNFFKDMTKKNGEDFDTYIDNWAKRLLNNSQ